MGNQVRLIRREDLPELVRLCREHAEYERAGWHEYERSAKLESMLLGNEDVRCWVVDGAGELAGFASAMVERSTWDAGHFLHLDCLFLRPKYRRLGLGRALIAEVARWAVQKNMSGMQWQTPRWNQLAARFYERLGAAGAEKIRYSLPLERCAELIGDDPDPSEERDVP